LLIINDGEDLIKKVNVLVLDKSDLKNSQNQNHSELVNKDVVDHIQIDFFTLIQVRMGHAEDVAEVKHLTLMVILNAAKEIT
jgi:chorismate mutase